MNKEAMTKTLYYAHSIRTYGSKKERKEIKRIKKMFPDHTLINPALIDFTGLDGEQTMDVCKDAVRQASIVVATEYQKHVGKGVATELEEATKAGVERYLLRGRKFIPTFAIRLDNREDWSINYARCIEGH